MSKKDATGKLVGHEEKDNGWHAFTLVTSDGDLVVESKQKDVISAGKEAIGSAVAVNYTEKQRGEYTNRWANSFKTIATTELPAELAEAEQPRRSLGIDYAKPKTPEETRHIANGAALKAACDFVGQSMPSTEDHEEMMTRAQDVIAIASELSDWVMTHGIPEKPTEPPVPKAQTPVERACALYGAAKDAEELKEAFIKVSDTINDFEGRWDVFRDCLNAVISYTQNPDYDKAVCEEIGKKLNFSLQCVDKKEAPQLPEGGDVPF